MRRIERELHRLEHTLIWRGAAMFALGLAAVIWPEDILIVAMIAVGIIATLFGLYEITIALTVRRQTSAWTLILLHGIASLLFGALTAGAPGLTLRVALVVTAGWMLLYAALAITVALIVWQMRGIRWTLLAWAGVDVLVAFISVLYPEATIFALLFFGAAYAALFGAWQVLTGLWIRRRFAHRAHAVDLTDVVPAHP